MPTGVGAAVSWIGANAAAVGAVASAATGAYAAKQQSSQAKKSAAAQKLAAESVKPLGQQDKPQEAKEVDTSAIQKRNAQMAAAAGQLGGNQATLLSGNNGIATNTLNLGVSSLLGQ